MRSKAIQYPLLILVFLVVFALACGDNNTGVKVDEQEAGPTLPPPTMALYGVGDVIQVGDQTVVLNSANVEGTMLKANFTIENKGAEEINLSSMLSFSAKDSEGSKLHQEIFDCGSGLGGKILAGDKIKGDICWSGAVGDTFKIYYEAKLFSTGAVVWQISK